MDEDLYNTLFMTSHSSRKKQYQLRNKDLQYQLHLPVKKDEVEASYEEVKANASHQADILYMPTDKFGFKMILVVVDIFTRMCDAEPLKKRDAISTLKAIMKIYKRNTYITEPQLRIICDDGGEFKGSFKEYFAEKQIYVKKLPAGKHIGIVDNKIKMIGRALFRIMENKELKTNKPSKEWVKHLPLVIEKFNEFTVISQKKLIEKNKKKQEKYPDDPDETNIKFPKNNAILKIGTKVRIALYKPKDILDKKLGTNFRETDIRWTKQVKEITNYMLHDNSPIMYIVNNDNSTPYSRQRIQVIKGDTFDVDDYD